MGIINPVFSLKKALPLSVSPRLSTLNRACATIGTSLTAQGVGSSGLAIQRRTLGWQTWVSQLTGHRVEFPVGLNFAVSGSTIQQVIDDQLAPCIAACQAQGVDTVHVEAGANDDNSDWETMRGQYETIRKALTDAGLTIIWMTTPPKGSPTFFGVRRSATQNKLLSAARQWVMTRTLAQGVLPYDIWPSVEDQAGVGGDWLDENTRDGVHWSSRSAYRVGLVAKPVFESRFPPRFIMPMSSVDDYDATLNPFGNICPNPYMLGDNAGLANNTSLAAVTGITIIPSIHIDTNGVFGPKGARWQKIVASGNSANADPRPGVSFSITNADVAPGYYHRFQVAYWIEALSTGVKSVTLRESFSGISNPSQSYDNDGSLLGGISPGLCPAEAHGGVLRTDPLLIDAAVSGPTLSCYLSCIQNVAMSATLYVRAPDLRRVT